MKTNIGISDKDVKITSGILATLLADQHVLYVKTRNYHWNVEGENFIQHHEFFEKQYNELAAMIDEVAERMRYLGVKAPGTMAEFIDASQLVEAKDKKVNAKDMISNLLTDHETIIKALRSDIEKCDETSDAGTVDFLTANMQAHEKMAWMLRAHLM